MFVTETACIEDAMKNQPEAVEGGKLVMNVIKIPAVMERESWKVAPAHPGYEHGVRRMESFKTWPIALPVKGVDLARAGFFYTQQSDKVTCFVCGGSLHKWVPGDSAYNQHKKHFPNCEYIKTVCTRDVK